MTESDDDTDELFVVAAPLAVDRLGRTLMAVPAGRLRASYLEDRVKNAPALPLVRILACAQREAVMGVVHARVVVDTFGVIVEEGRLPATLSGAIAAGAIVLGEANVVPLITPPAANDSGKDDPVRAKRGSLAAAGETLGRRKSLARVAQNDMLMKLLDDPHPEVIFNVLANPRVTEAHAVRVAARRPVAPAVLDVVARSRFQTRAVVRRALVLNPDCPTQLALRLLASMTGADLKDVAASMEIPTDVRGAARRLLAESPKRG